MIKPKIQKRIKPKAKIKKMRQSKIQKNSKRTKKNKSRVKSTQPTSLHETNNKSGQ